MADGERSQTIYKKNKRPFTAVNFFVFMKYIHIPFFISFRDNEPNKMVPHFCDYISMYNIVLSLYN